MNDEQALDVLQSITAAYDHFKLSDKRIDLWCEQLQGMDYKGVMLNLKHHIATNKFPPAISEIAAQAKEDNRFLDEQNTWRQEVKREKANGHTKTFIDYLPDDLKSKYQPLMGRKER